MKGISTTPEKRLISRGMCDKSSRGVGALPATTTTIAGGRNVSFQLVDVNRR